MMQRPACSIMRRTRSGRADRRSNWRRVAPRSSAAGSVAPSRGEREPSRRRSPQPPAASRQPYSRTAVSRQLAVAVAAAAAAAVSELLRRVADAVWTRAAQRRASVLGVGSARARADGACKQTACTAHSFKIVNLGSAVVRESCRVKFLFSSLLPPPRLWPRGCMAPRRRTGRAARRMAARRVLSARSHRPRDAQSARR